LNASSPGTAACFAPAIASVQDADAAVERLAEARLLVEAGLADQARALGQLRIDAAHLRDHVARDLVQERRFDAEQPAVIDAPPHDPAQHVFAPGLVGKTPSAIRNAAARAWSAIARNDTAVPA
jgi:hypothetical protein